MTRCLLILALSFLAAVAVHGFCDICECNECECIPEDPIGYDPRLEVVHLFTNQWPTGIAINSCGRQFICFPSAADSDNTNDGCNGRIKVAEITPCGECPYPNFCINNPPCGDIDYSVCPPVTRNYEEYFIDIRALKIYNDYLYLLDGARARDKNQILYEGTGGAKIVVVNTCTDSVVRIYPLPLTIATPTSILIDIVVDVRSNVAYISDGLKFRIIGLDLKTGQSWIAFEDDPTLRSIPGGLPFVWGQPSYRLSTSICGENTVIGSFVAGVAGLTLSPDGKKLYYTQLGGRKLYSVKTASLAPGIPSSEVAKTIENHGEKGPAVGLATDSNGIVWSGNAEADSIVMYNPNCKFARTKVYIRDKRLSWVNGISIPGDGYCYFIINSFNGQRLTYHGTGPLYADTKRKPYVLFRFKLPCTDLCPNACDPATLGFYPPGGCKC